MPPSHSSPGTPTGRFETPPRELVVIADPGAGLVARPGMLEAAAADISPVSAALADAGAQIVPLFGPSEERVRYELAQAASVAGPGAETEDLSVYYRVAASDDQLDDLAKTLYASEGILGAYVAPAPEPPVALDIVDAMAPRDDVAPPASPDYRPRQGYLGAAPAGVDAQYAWTKPGGKGQNVRIIDIEGAWRFDHEDLLVNQGGTVGTPSGDIGWRNHGTAVVSVFGGDENTFGVTGISPASHTRGFSIFGGSSPAAAITAAANALSPGDIILIELHRPGPGASGAGQDGFIAMEWWPAELAAIKFAVFTKGIVVVEAAGNGSRNLDSAIYNTPQAGFPASWKNPFNRANVDSGAILVGAGAPPPGTHGADHGPDRSRLAFSNYGASVDAQGWGREVTSCGYGDLQGGASEKIWYTDTFSGTSSASPCVVGVCACIQGIRKAQGQSPRTAAQMRQILRTTGSPQTDAPGRPKTQRIGNRPDLKQILGPVIKRKDTKEIKEGKEKREKNEKIEFKDIEKKTEVKEIEKKGEFKEIEKFQLEKAQGLDKLQQLENIQVKRVGEVKPREVQGIEQIQGRPDIGYDIEQRLAAIENAIGELAHFIPTELRPDLSLGALSDEADLSGTEGEDIEKLGEGY